MRHGDLREKYLETAYGRRYLKNRQVHSHFVANTKSLSIKSVLMQKTKKFFNQNPFLAFVDPQNRA